MARYLSREELRDMKVFMMAGDGPDAKTVYGINKCFFPLQGKAVVDHMLDQFYDAGMKEIYLVGKESDMKTYVRPQEGLRYIDTQGLISANISRITDEVRFRDEEPVLVMFSDTPFFSERALYDFVGRCDLDEADFFHPLVPKEYIALFDSYFRRNYVHTHDIDFRVNCMSLVKPAKLNLRNVQRVADNRKVDCSDPDFGENTKSAKFMRSMAILRDALPAIGPAGVVFASKLLLSAKMYREGQSFVHEVLDRCCHLADINRYAGRMFGVRAQGVMFPHGETTLDLDCERNADTFARHFDDIGRIVTREHEIIDTLNENSYLMREIASDENIHDKGRALHERLMWKADAAFLRVLKDDPTAFQRMLAMYGKR